MKRPPFSPYMADEDTGRRTRNVVKGSIGPTEARGLGAKAHKKGEPMLVNPFVGVVARYWTQGWKRAEGLTPGKT